MKNGRRFEITLLTTPTSYRTKILAALPHMLAAVGIKATGQATSADQVFAVPPAGPLYTGSYDLNAGRFPPARTFVTFPYGATFVVVWSNDPLVAPAHSTIELRYPGMHALRPDPVGHQLH